jgi:cellulose biosynthesis protein BcsQ
MKSIVFFNNKGGVGKTTLLCNLAAYLSIKKVGKVLIVDVDPQCNSTTYILPEEKMEAIYGKSSR